EVAGPAYLSFCDRLKLLVLQIPAAGLPSGPPSALLCLAHCVCSKVATVLISLRAYFGKPALIELPKLNEDRPMRTCAGTRLRSTGIFSKLRFCSSTLALIASATNAVTTVLPAARGWA